MKTSIVDNAAIVKAINRQSPLVHPWTLGVLVPYAPDKELLLALKLCLHHFLRPTELGSLSADKVIELDGRPVRILVRSIGRGIAPTRYIPIDSAHAPVLDALLPRSGRLFHAPDPFGRLQRYAKILGVHLTRRGAWQSCLANAHAATPGRAICGIPAEERGCRSMPDSAQNSPLVTIGGRNTAEQRGTVRKNGEQGNGRCEIASPGATVGANSVQPPETSSRPICGKDAETKQCPSRPDSSQNHRTGASGHRNNEEQGGTSAKIREQAIGKTLGSNPSGTLAKTPVKAGVLQAKPPLRKNMRKTVFRQTQSL